MTPSERACTQCLARGIRVTAWYVAADGVCLEWFECDEHDATDNVAGVTRTTRTPIAEWRAARGLVND